MLVVHGWGACFSNGAALDGDIGAVVVEMSKLTYERGLRGVLGLWWVFFTLTI